MLETINKELLNSLKEIGDEDGRELEELVGHIKNTEETSEIIKQYEEILKTKNAKIINIVGN